MRFPFPRNFETSLNGRVVESVERRAKYLLIRLDGDMTWLCHLGMSGRWTLIGDGVIGRPGKFSSGAPLGSGDGPHDWVVIHLDSGTKAVYSDHRRFGFMDCFPLHNKKKQASLGFGSGAYPRPISSTGSRRRTEGRKMPIKSALLDQRIIAGLGNIYVCEILHRAGVSPRRKASSVAGLSGISRRVERITAATHDVITEAIDAGGSTLQDFRGVDGDEAMGYFIHNFLVYGRENQQCLKEGCSGSIRRIVQSNRSTFYCSSCQR